MRLWQPLTKTCWQENFCVLGGSVELHMEILNADGSRSSDGRCHRQRLPFRLDYMDVD